MKKQFELKIFMQSFNKYDVYVGGQVVVICNGINITRYNESNSESIVSDYYFSLFEIWLRALQTVIRVIDEVRCPLSESPFDFVFKRHDTLVDVTLHYTAAGGPDFDKKMGGRGKPIAVPLRDFVEEILDKANYFINFMLEKNSKIADDSEFQSIVKRKEESEKAWSDYLKG